MPSERYYIDGEISEGSLELSGDEFFHLKRVMRQRPGERVELVNGRGALAFALIETIANDFALLNVERVEQFSRKEQKLILLQGILKMAKNELVVEKGCELGADEILFFEGERSEKGEFSKNQMERLQKIEIAAMKQSGRLYHAEIFVEGPLRDWKGPLVGFFGDLREGAPSLLEVALPKGDVLSLAVGPESGLSAREEKRLMELGLTGVRLSENVLRAETAAIAGLALLGARDYEL